MLGIIICSAFLMFQQKIIDNRLLCKSNNVLKEDDNMGDKLDEKYKLYTGLCEVEIQNKTDETREMDRIIEHFKNYELLKTLNSSFISVQEKIDIIKQNEILNLDMYKTNIKSGGLLDDWDFYF